MAGKYTVIKRFSDNYYCVTQLNHNLKDPERLCIPKLDKEWWVGYDEKLRESIVRSRTRIWELSMCNDWELFCTFTIDPKKYDRYNLKAYYKDFSKFINNLNYQHELNIKYLLIPEMHQDGAWHMHGFFMGLSRYQLRRFSLKEKLPRKLRKRISLGILYNFGVFDWPSYRSRFGFCSFEYIRDRESAAKYVTKYITKDLAKSVQDLNAKTYYCSKGLKRPEVVFKGEHNNMIAIPDFANVFMSRKDFFDYASALECNEVKFVNSFLEAGFDDNKVLELCMREL